MHIIIAPYEFHCVEVRVSSDSYVRASPSHETRTLRSHNLLTTPNRTVEGVYATWCTGLYSDMLVKHVISTLSMLCSTENGLTLTLTLRWSLTITFGTACPNLTWSWVSWATTMNCIAASCFEGASICALQLDICISGGSPQLQSPCRRTLPCLTTMMSSYQYKG